jgi:hypothetical protein
MLDYPLEVFSSPVLIQIYSHVVVIMVGVNTISLSCMTYIIAYHGKILDTYRWLLLISYYMSYIVDLILALGHIVQFLPATIFYFDGIIGKYFDSKILLCVVFCAIEMKLLMMVCITLYRFANSTFGPLQEFFSVPRNLILVFGVHTVLGFSPMFLLLLKNRVRFI